VGQIVESGFADLVLLACLLHQHAAGMAPADSLWVPGAEPKHLISCRVQCKADDLFRTLWVAPDLQAQLHKLRNDTNLVETSWVASRAELPAEKYTWQPGNDGAGKNIVASNRWRKVRFESPPAAMATKPFQNEEVQHCVDYKPGQRYIMEAMANTSAPYGDKFDVLFRTSILAETKTTCFLHVVFDVSWYPSMNRMLKGMVTKAVEGGVRGTYKTYRQILDNFFTVQDVPESHVVEAEQEGGEGAAEHRPEVHRPAVAQPPAPMPMGQPHKLDFVSFAVGQLVWGDQITALSGVVGGGLDASEGSMARVLAVVVTLSLVHTAVSMLHSVQAFCSASRGLLWLLCLPVTHLIDVPDSVYQVLCSLALVAAINYAVISAARASTPDRRPPHGQHTALRHGHHQASPGHGAAHASTDGGAAAGAGTAAAAAAAPPTSAPASSTTSPSKVKPGKGGKPPSGATKSSASAPSLGAVLSGRAASPVVRLLGVGGPGLEMTAMGGGPKSGVTSPTAAGSLVGSPPDAASSWLGSFKQTFGLQAGSASSAAGGAANGATPKLDSTEEGDEKQEGGELDTVSIGSKVPPRAATMPAQQVEGSKAGTNGGGAPSTGAAAVAAAPKPPPRAASQVVYGAKYPLSAMVSEMEAMKRDTAMVAAAKEAAATVRRAPSIESMPASMVSALEEQELPESVEEEMFENERFQPFRGWGHTWPGHFLPSDRVGHWGDRKGLPGGSASMVFEQVEPPLPPGYRWLEDEWQLDLEGMDQEAVDENGWSYALDFNYLKYPHPPGGGKCTLKHFVRRRRWFRTRVREPLGSVPQEQHMSKERSESQALSPARSASAAGIASPSAQGPGSAAGTVPGASTGSDQALPVATAAAAGGAGSSAVSSSGVVAAPTATMLHVPRVAPPPAPKSPRAAGTSAPESNGSSKPPGSPATNIDDAAAAIAAALGSSSGSRGGEAAAGKAAGSTVATDPFVAAAATAAATRGSSDSTSSAPNVNNSGRMDPTAQLTTGAGSIASWASWHDAARDASGAVVSPGAAGASRGSGSSDRRATTSPGPAAAGPASTGPSTGSSVPPTVSALASAAAAAAGDDAAGAGQAAPPAPGAGARSSPSNSMEPRDAGLGPLGSSTGTGSGVIVAAEMAGDD